MTEADIEIIVQRARELFPDARPRIISDNGPQFIARDFKEFIRISGMTHVRTSPGVSRRSMPRGIGSWRQRENSGRFVGSRLREERRGPVSGQPKHRMTWITLEVGFARSPWPTLWSHSTISPLLCPLSPIRFIYTVWADDLLLVSVFSPRRAN
jgi:hypothetical protein